MKLQDLQIKFLNARKFEPSNSNELLDFAKHCYLCNQLSIKEYRDLVKQLEEAGASTPEDMVDEYV